MVDRKLVEQNKFMSKNFERETEALQELKHPNIVGIVDLVKTKTAIYLIIDYCNGGTLDDLIGKRGFLS